MVLFKILVIPILNYCSVILCSISIVGFWKTSKILNCRFLKKNQESHSRLMTIGHLSMENYCRICTKSKLQNRT